MLSSDNQIMLQVKSGEIEKLGLLFERHKNEVYAYFYRNTFNKSSCDDLTQNVFYRILTYRTKFDGYGKFTTWMYHIAHNVLVDHYKKTKKLDLTTEFEDENIRDQAQADTHYLEKEKQQLLTQALQKLESGQREALTLSKYQGLKYKEIGEILGCSEGAVKVRIFRALSSLKEIYLKLEE